MSGAHDNLAVIRTEASAWLAQLESGGLDTADVDAFREWVTRSPRHADEIRRLAKLSGELNALTGLAGALAHAAASRRSVVKARGAGWRAFAAAAAFFLAVGWLWLTAVQEPAPYVATLATGVGEYREYQLPDGTDIHLNTNSRLQVAFADTVRNVVLRDGEAMFDVAPDPARPFVVHAGRQRVQAVGTAFLVRLVRDEVQVSVTEGKVVLTSLAPRLEQPDVAAAVVGEAIYLGMGQSVKLPARAEEPAVQVEAVSDDDLRRRLAWREGLLDFHRTPLSQVVLEVNRHTGKLILIEDPRLRATEFDGLFRVGETELLLEALRLRPEIEVRRVDADTVLLSRKTP